MQNTKSPIRYDQDITVRVDKKMKSDIQKAAKKLGVPISEMLRAVLSEKYQSKKEVKQEEKKQ